MSVTNALSRVPGALTRNPIIVAVFAAFALLQIPMSVAQAIDPIVGSIVSLGLTGLLLLLSPFFQAGAMKMADEGLDGRTSLDSFLSAGKEYYLSMLGAFALVFAVNFVLVIVGFVASFVVGVAAIGAAGGPGAAGGGAFLLVLLVYGVLALAYLGFAFFVQFYGQEIVLNGASAIDGITQSVGLVRRNLLSTLGYFVVLLVLGFVFTAVIVVLSILVLGIGGATGTGPGMATPSVTTSLLQSIVVVVLVTVMSSVVTVFSVSFWRTIRNRGSTAAAGL